MARYAATQNALEKGLDQVAPGAGAKLLDDWIAQLEGNEKRGIKGLAGDLARLKTELERESPREANVLKLVGKLGAATTKVAAQAEGGNVDKLKQLGEALANAGHAHDADEDEAND